MVGVGLPSEEFKVSGNALRAAATLIAVVGIVATVAADRLNVGHRLDTLEAAEARRAARDSVNAMAVTKASRRLCLILTNTEPPPGVSAQWGAERDACLQELAR